MIEGCFRKGIRSPKKAGNGGTSVPKPLPNEQIDDRKTSISQEPSKTSSGKTSFGFVEQTAGRHAVTSIAGTPGAETRIHDSWISQSK